MKIKTPKYITFRKDLEKYMVSVFSKSHQKMFYVGIFDDLDTAINERDSFIIENLNDITKFNLPRGVSRIKNNKYQSYLSIGKFYKQIGSYDTIDEAYMARKIYILSLI
jgi:GTPase Era involved in 16S rRNA processing